MLSLYPFQQKVIADGLRILRGSASKGAILACDMGTGKTVMAISIVNRMFYRRVLVICNEQIRHVTWDEHIRDWQNPDSPMRIYHLSAGNAGLYSGNFLRDLERGWCVLSYSMLHKYPGIRDRQWDLVICDESIAAKNPTSRRTRALFGEMDHAYSELDTDGVIYQRIPARKYLMVSGAPNPNRLEEIFPTLNTLDPDHWPSIEHFADQFYSPANEHMVSIDANGRVSNGTLVRGARDRLEQKLINDGLMLRVTKADALPDLPPKVYERQMIGLPMGSVVWGHMFALWGRRLDVINAMRCEDADIAELMQVLQGIHREMQELAGTSSVKLDAVAEYLLGLNEKAVVFALHIDAIDALIERLRKAGKRTLRLTAAETKRTAEIVKQFNNPNGPQFLVSNMTVGGHGLNLQKVCSLVVFAELDWNADTMLQCEDRCHRAGQTREVRIRHFLLSHSLDANIFYALEGKGGWNFTKDMEFERNDGGRAAAGFVGACGDCVARAISIAFHPDGRYYRMVYDHLKEGKGKSPRNGCPHYVYRPYLVSMGWKQVEIQATLIQDIEFPPGRVIVENDRHLVCVVDGVFHDTGEQARKAKNAVSTSYWVMGEQE
jgi:hypothetical protein